MIPKKQPYISSLARVKANFAGVAKPGSEDFGTPLLALGLVGGNVVMAAVNAQFWMDKYDSWKVAKAEADAEDVELEPGPRYGGIIGLKQ